MKCRKCDHHDTKVIESREVADGDATRRRRKCPVCDARFTTYERVERPNLVVIKHNGSRELFNRAKLSVGIHRACDKTPVTNMQIESLVASIENQLYDNPELEVSSEDIGKIVMSHMADLSEVAYVRFASVYRRFTDIDSFEAELEQIRSKKQHIH